MIFSFAPGELTGIKFVNTKGKKTAAQVHQGEQCHLAVNGTLYNMKTFVPCMDVRANGVTLALETGKNGPHYPGFAWNNGDTKMVYADQPEKWDNYITGTWLCREGKPEATYLWDGTGGARQRTGIGTRDDGGIVVFCDTQNRTPDQLRTIMMDAGCTFIMMMDSGGSTQCSSYLGNVTQARKVGNFICFYKEGNPYKEPTTNIAKGSKGEGAYWVQWYLNKLKCRDTLGRIVKADGIFGASSVAALKRYQTAHGLKADGICGARTREMMKKEVLNG